MDKNYYMFITCLIDILNDLEKVKTKDIIFCKNDNDYKVKIWFEHIAEPFTICLHVDKMLLLGTDFREYVIGIIKQYLWRFN